MITTKAQKSFVLIALAVIVVVLAIILFYLVSGFSNDGSPKANSDLTSSTSSSQEFRLPESTGASLPTEEEAEYANNVIDFKAQLPIETSAFIVTFDRDQLVYNVELKPSASQSDFRSWYQRNDISQFLEYSDFGFIYNL